jgi:hemolysin activation/secretion protein
MPAKYAGLSYDLFAGTPIHKPTAFPTARATVGAQAAMQF